MDQKKSMGVMGILAALLLAIGYFGVGSKESLYAILAAIVILVVYLRNDFEKNEQDKLAGQFTELSQKGVLSEKEKKYLIFYFLSKVRELNEFNLDEFAREYDFPIFSLNALVEWMIGHELVEADYSQSEKLPWLSVKSKEKLGKMRVKLFNSLTPRDFIGNPLKTEFSREFHDFLDSHRRST